MLGDPDWDEITARSERILADARTTDAFLGASAMDLAAVLQNVISDEVESVARMEILRRRMPASPGISHGVAQAYRKVALLIEAQRRLTTLQRSAA